MADPATTAAILQSAAQLIDVLFGSSSQPRGLTPTQLINLKQQINQKAVSGRVHTREQVDGLRQDVIKLINAQTDVFVDESSSPDEIAKIVNGIVLNSNNQLLKDINNNIDDIIQEQNTTTENILNRSISTILDSIDNVIISNGGLIDGVKSVLDGGIDSILDGIIGLGKSIFNDFKQTINNVIELDSTFITNVIDSVLDPVIDIIDGNNTVLDGVLIVLDEAIEQDRLLTQTIIDTLPGSVQDGIEATREIVDVLKEFLKDPGLVIDNTSDKAILGTIKDWVLGKDKTDKSVEEIGREFLDIIIQNTELELEHCERLFATVENDVPIVHLLGNIIIGFFTLAILPVSQVSAKAQRCMFAWNVLNPTKILEPADSITAFQRGLQNIDFTSLNLQQHGYNPQDAEKLIKTLYQLPDETLMFSMWLRNIINTDQLHDGLRGRGYNAEWIDRYKEAIFFIPPVQDLVTMSVREVFNKEVAEKFGQFEDFPEDFAKFARQQGVSREWAERYWAAHWALPSVQLGYEMLHRGVIDNETLLLLLKSQDVMPFWRDKLLQISFAPFTRVDIRRMNKVGVLSSEETKRAYMDIGYNDEKAQKLLEFTEELNKDNNILDVTDISELTRSNILQFYVDGILPRQVAYGMLLAVGFDIATAELWLTDIDLKEEAKERKEEAELVITQAKNGVITFERANDDLNRLNLTSLEILKYQRKLTQAEASAVKLPSKADIDKMFGAGIIDETVYIDTMQKIGYPKIWIDRYLQLLNKGEDNG